MKEHGTLVFVIFIIIVIVFIVGALAFLVSQPRQDNWLTMQSYTHIDSKEVPVYCFDGDAHNWTQIIRVPSTTLFIFNFYDDGARVCSRCGREEIINGETDNKWSGCVHSEFLRWVARFEQDLKEKSIDSVNSYINPDGLSYLNETKTGD